MMRKPKIIFYIHALAGGGAERVWSVLASAFAARGYEVVFAVDYESSDNRRYLRPDIRLVVLGGPHWQTLRRLRRLLLVEKPDVVASALAASNLKLVLAGLFAGCLSRTIISYHGYAESEPQTLSTLSFGMSAILTRLAARTICVSDGLLHYLRAHWGASRLRTQRIHNPVLVEGNVTATDAASLAARSPIVLAIGRFTRYKNFVGLIHAFAWVGDPAARLILLGDGPDRPAIVAEIERLGLQQRVDMPGYVAEPWSYFQRAKCFVLTSHSESFGLVIVEAMAHGLEIVATDCDGPREILAHGRFGALVPHDTQAIASAITRALESPTDPKPRIDRAQAFSVGAAVDRYETLFRAVMSGAPAASLEPVEQSEESSPILP